MHGSHLQAPTSAQPFNMFGGGGGGGGGPAASGPLDFLRSNPQFLMLRRAVQANPQILVPMLQVSVSLIDVVQDQFVQPVLCKAVSLCWSRLQGFMFAGLITGPDPLVICGA